MGVATTISIMGGASIAAIAACKIAIESGNVNIAQYIDLFTSSTLATMALTAGLELVRFIAGL